MFEFGFILVRAIALSEQYLVKQYCNFLRAKNIKFCNSAYILELLTT